MADEVGLEDSVSQLDGGVTASRVSGASSARARAEAERRALIARSKYCQREAELRRAQQRLEEELSQLQLSALIDAASAREEVFAQYEAADVRPSSHLSERQPPVTNTQFACLTQMNPMATEFNPGSQSAVPVDPELLLTNAGNVAHEVSPPTQHVFNNQKFGVDSAVSTNNIPELIATLKLPQAQIMKFDGDPMKYWTFIRTFDNCIGNVAIDAATKLNRLQQYCTGKALKVIECCAVMEPELGYQRARHLLKSRFGNEYQISECWIQKIVGGASVKAGDGTGLQELADDARVCKETLEAMDMLDEIDTRAKMVKIVNRLPQYLQAKWRHLAIKHLDCNTRYPRFVQLVEFLEQVSRELNDPVFGCTATSNQKDRGKAQGISLMANGSGNQYSTATRELRSQHSTSDPNKVSRTCYHCLGGHLLIACQKFKQMNPTRRLDAVKKLKLCFNCLGSKNHVANKCHRQGQCDVSGCNMKHSSLLHDALVNSQKQSNVSGDSANSNQTVQAQSCACGPGIHR